MYWGSGVRQIHDVVPRGSSKNIFLQEKYFLRVKYTMWCLEVRVQTCKNIYPLKFFFAFTRKRCALNVVP
jgi:hypothetical protein